MARHEITEQVSSPRTATGRLEDPNAGAQLGGPGQPRHFPWLPTGSLRGSRPPPVSVGPSACCKVRTEVPGEDSAPSQLAHPTASSDVPQPDPCRTPLRVAARGVDGATGQGMQPAGQRRWQLSRHERQSLSAPPAA